MKRDNSSAVICQEHPLQPFVPRGASVLLLGSFPPPEKRWSMNFFYPNFQNDMWRIMGLLFYGDREHFVLKDRKAFDYCAVTSFCRDKGIGLYDAAVTVRRLRGNASDNFLEIVEPADIAGLIMSMPSCTKIASTGGKSAETVAGILGTDVPATGDCVRVHVGEGRTVDFYRMPSSSRAYPMPIEKKAEYYARLFGLTL